LIGVVALWGVRDYEHRRAVNALEARSYESADPIRASAFPLWWSPFRWVGVVETRNFYASMMVDSTTPEVDPDGEMQILYKPEETPATLAAKQSYLGRVYLDWAQYPITETEPLTSGGRGDMVRFLVRFKDLRFQQPGRSGRSVLSATVVVDRNLNVVGEFFGLGKSGSSSGSAGQSGAPVD
jgi:inner membrane protein